MISLRRIRSVLGAAALALAMPAFALPAHAEEAPRTLHELAPLVGFYTGDALRGMTLGGLEYTWHAWDEFSLAAGVQAGAAAIDDDTRIDVHSGDLFGIATLAVVWDFPIRFGLEEDAPLANFYTSIGPAYVRLGDEEAWGGFIGGGIVVQTGWCWLALRADFKSLFYSVRNLSGQNFNADVNLALGPAIQF